jgi:hypothetical protein
VALVQDKYRGTKEYRIVRDEMIKAAKQGHPIYYAEIAEIMGLPPSGHYMGKEVGYMGGEISEDEHSQGRPMLSAVAVSVTRRIPGSGFFDLARGLGKLQDSSEQAERRFWKEELRAVYAAWQADEEGAQ